MTKTYQPARPIWCAGCGHFGVENALREALRILDIAPHDTMILAGIGCSGTVQNNLGTYGYHALHGRVLPTAIGTALGNPDLTVIAAGGDGDGYAIGMGHLIHTFKRNPSLLYVLMNNGTYGLTKGQDSPTAETPRAAPAEAAVDGIALGLALQGSSFLARGSTTRPRQLNDLMVEALQHVQGKQGFGFLEVLSPCVTYNDTYPKWDALVQDIGECPGFNPKDRITAHDAYNRLVSAGHIPTGVIYSGNQPTYEQNFNCGKGLDPQADPVEFRNRLKAIQAQHAV